MRILSSVRFELPVDDDIGVGGGQAHQGRRLRRRLDVGLTVLDTADARDGNDRARELVRVVGAQRGHDRRPIRPAAPHLSLFHMRRYGGRRRKR
jgi:hypothetical protein